MGIDVRVQLVEDVDVRMHTAIRRGLQATGEKVLLASDVLAPTEPTPRHGVHMIDTGMVKVEPGTDSDSVMVGYGAFWSLFQHEDLWYHHPHGGGPKFLERAAMGAVEVIAESVAVEVDQALS